MSSSDVLSLAARRFVTQDFSGSADKLESLLNAPSFAQEPLEFRLRAWALQTTLAGFAFTAPTKWTTPKYRDIYQNIVVDGSLWKLWPKLTELPPSHIAKTVSLMADYSTQLKLTSDIVEQYLSLLGTDQAAALSESEQTAYAQLVETFVLRVLASDELAEYNYARELAQNFSSILGTKTVLKLIASVDKREEDSAARRKQLAQQELDKKAEIARQEQLRVTKAIEESQELVAPQDSEPKRETPKPLRSIGSRQSLMMIWRQSFGQFVQSATLKNVIIVVLVLLSVMSNRPLRQNVRAGSSWFWQALKQSARMGLTVTYL